MDNNPKYKMHGKAKVCFILSMIMLFASIINIVLSMTVLPGIHSVLSIILTMVSVILITITTVDRLKFEQKNNPHALKKDEKEMIYLLIGAVIGFIWGKFIL